MSAELADDLWLRVHEAKNKGKGVRLTADECTLVMVALEWYAAQVRTIEERSSDPGMIGGRLSV